MTHLPSLDEAVRRVHRRRIPGTIYPLVNASHRAASPKCWCCSALIDDIRTEYRKIMEGRNANPNR